MREQHLGPSVVRSTEFDNESGGNSGGGATQTDTDHFAEQRRIEEAS